MQKYTPKTIIELDVEEATQSALTLPSIAEYIQKTKEKAAAICKRHDIEPDAAEAMGTDAADMLGAHYYGLHASIEQMQSITQQTTDATWARVDNAALGFIYKYYTGIVKILGGGEYLGDISINATIYVEAAKRLGITPGELLQRMGANASEDYDYIEDVQRFYCTYAVLILGENTAATEEELKHIYSSHGYKVTDVVSQQIKRTNVWRNKRTSDAEARAAKRANRHQGDAEVAKEKTLYVYQNMAQALGDGLQTADTDADGRIMVMRPIRQAVAEQKRKAEDFIKNNPDADASEIQRAKDFIATAGYVTHVANAFQILPQLEQPKSGSTKYISYTMTPRHIAQLVLNVDIPNNEQIYGVCRAIAFFSMQRTSVLEDVQVTTTYVGEDGKRKRNTQTKQLLTNFQPSVVTFKKWAEENVPIEEALTLDLDINRIYIDGRSAEYLEDDKKKGRILKSKKQYLTLPQYEDFTSDEEQIFRNIILSRPKLAEDKMLAAIFNYEARQAEYDAALREAQEAEARVKARADATKEQKEEAEKKTASCQNAAKYGITNKMDRDYKRLIEMFEKAVKNGLINYYDRTIAAYATPKTKYGKGYIRKWEKRKTKEAAE